MPGTPSSAIQLPQVLFAKIMASDTIRSSGAPRMRLLICTTGTSVATGVGPFHGDGDAEAFRERIRARVRSLDDPQRPDDLLRAVSA